METLVEQNILSGLSQAEINILKRLNSQELWQTIGRKAKL